MFAADLTAPVSNLIDGELQVSAPGYSRWVVCTQDCDLAWAEVERDKPLVEIRPVLVENPPAEWGIRSRTFRLNDSDYVSNDLPRALLTPSALASMSGGLEYNLDGSRSLGFKSWLGRRYDRPAVPERLVEVARTIAELCSRRDDRSIAEEVHDVLMQFEYSNPPKVKLFGVATTSGVKEEIRLWLARVASELSPTLGIVTDITVGTKAEISLELVEQSYSADLSQVTWRGENPTGVTR